MCKTCGFLGVQSVFSVLCARGPVGANIHVILQGSIRHSYYSSWHQLGVTVLAVFFYNAPCIGLLNRNGRECKRF
jgi:hypothetical protein